MGFFSSQVFKMTSMADLRAKSLLLTAYLYYLVELYFGENSPQRSCRENVTVLTPANPEERGAQLSLYFSTSITEIHKEMGKRA